MGVGYHQWLHTARPDLVRRDFELAGGWLARFQDAASGPPAFTGWVAEVIDMLQRRWWGHSMLGPALERLARAAEGLDGLVVEQTCVHGEFDFEHLLLGPDGVSGVVNWTRGELDGSPLRDLGRFVVSYSAALHLGAGPGSRVVGHPGLRRVGGAPGLRYTLLEKTWYTRVVRGFLADGLTRLGLPSDRCGAVFVAAIGEFAATSLDQRAAEDHLVALADLPA